MAERTQKKTTPERTRTEEHVEDAAGIFRPGRQAEGGARRLARRDRRSARIERGGLREVLRPKGWPIDHGRGPVTSLAPMASMPFFTPGDDPGSSFPALLQRIGMAPFAGQHPDADRGRDLDVPHATTCVAARFDGGVVMAGDRRATSGNLISHRTMEKVAQADSHSGVAIAGAAGPAMEMVKLFQLQLEHYEKVEGQLLSLDGKANQLSMLLRGNLRRRCRASSSCRSSPATTCAAGVGRLFAYDVTGGRYEELEYVATGSGSLHAGTVVKVGYRSIADRETKRSRWCCGRCGRRPTRTRPRAAPTRLRGIYPVVATIEADGFARVADDDLRQRYEAIAAEVGSAMSTPFYVAPEQVMKDRADYARKGIARGRAAVAVIYADGVALVRREPVEHPAQGQRDLRPHRLRRRRQVQRVRPAPRGRGARRRPQGVPVLP